MSCAAYVAPKCFFVSSVPFLDNIACLKRKKNRKHLVHITGAPATILLWYMVKICFTQVFFKQFYMHYDEKQHVHKNQ